MAQPKTKNSSYLAAPSQIELDGNVRKDSFASPIGLIEMKWPRKVESLFGSTPLKSTIEASRVFKKAVSKAFFPPHVQNINLKWNIIFLDESLPSEQIPQKLINGCHPGWMTPRGGEMNIYIVAQRVAKGCNPDPNKKITTAEADKELARVLTHELAHALEFLLLKGNMGNDGMRAEGFASWFENYAAKISNLMNDKEILDYHKKVARYSFLKQPNAFKFTGTALDYSRASMYFFAIEDKFGTPGIVRVYNRMIKTKEPFPVAITNELSLSPKRLNEEISKFLNK